MFKAFFNVLQWDHYSAVFFKLKYSYPNKTHTHTSTHARTHTCTRTITHRQKWTEGNIMHRCLDKYNYAIDDLAYKIKLAKD